MSEKKQVSFDIFEYFASKLMSKINASTGAVVDSELDIESENAIQNKAVAAALKNVEFLDLAYRTEIPENSNLDDYKTTGSFCVLVAAIAATITNSPITTAGYYLDVRRRGPDAIAQRATLWTGQEYTRHFNGTAWSSWWNTRANATTSANGLMSSTDKSKLDNTNIAYGTCDTAAATAAKVVTITGNTNWKLAVGSEIVVKFTNTNTASNCTLNVNNTGAKQLWYNNAVYTANSSTVSGYASRYIRYVYDGTYWVWMGMSLDANNVNTAGATDTSSKIFLIGATSQAANPQTYSHDTCYVGTDGCLYSNGKKVLTASEGGATIYTGTLTQATGTYTINLGVKPKFVLCYSNDEADSTRKWWAKSTSGGHPNITITNTGFQYAQVVNSYFSQYFIALA